MLRVNVRSIVLAVVVPVLFSAASVRATSADATRACDFAADIALELEDYPTSILLHRRLLRSDRTNALAHYHLGFAYGMVGQVEDEVHEYQLAAHLGEHDWHLFLNLGLAYLERHQFDQATAAFQTAMLLRPERAESQFDFVIFYEYQENPKDALLEIYEARVAHFEILTQPTSRGFEPRTLRRVLAASNAWRPLVVSVRALGPSRSSIAVPNRSTTQGGPTSAAALER